MCHKIFPPRNSGIFWARDLWLCVPQPIVDFTPWICQITFSTILYFWLPELSVFELYSVPHGKVLPPLIPVLLQDNSFHVLRRSHKSPPPAFHCSHQHMEDQVPSPPGWRVPGCLWSPQKCCSELWSSCCCIISIYAVSFFRVTTGPWSRHKHSDSPFCSLCPFLPHGSLCLPFQPSWSMGWMFQWHHAQWHWTLYWVITSDSMPECSFLLFLVVMCFSWLPYHLLTQ